MYNSKIKPDGFKSASWVGQGDEVDGEGKPLSGICKYCNQWDAELKDDGCRDRECIDARLNERVNAGLAMKVQMDVLDNDGKAVTIAELGGKKFLFEREK